MPIAFLLLLFVTEAWSYWRYAADRNNFSVLISEQLENHCPGQRITNIWIYKKTRTNRDHIIIRFANLQSIALFRSNFKQYPLQDSDVPIDLVIQVPSNQILIQILVTIHQIDPFDPNTLWFLRTRIRNVNNLGH